MSVLVPASCTAASCASWADRRWHSPLSLIHHTNSRKVCGLGSFCSTLQAMAPRPKVQPASARQLGLQDMPDEVLVAVFGQLQFQER